jgi:hypothetical protein
LWYPVLLQVGNVVMREGGKLVKRTMRTLADGTSAVLHRAVQSTMRTALDGASAVLKQAGAMSLVEHASLMQAGVSSYWTLEYALFPFLFPRGLGFFVPGQAGFKTLTSYLWYRTHQMFSGFTLYKIYVLLMYQMWQCDRLGRKVS